MLRRTILAISTVAFATCLAAPPADGQYRGMTPGWPNHSSGYYAGYAPAYGYAQPYAAARPVNQVQYVPAQAAYANPAYYGAYRAAPTQYQQAQYQQAQYVPQPTTAYYAPAQQAYAPTTAYYAPAPGYTVSPPGNVSAGAEAYAGYGQPTRVNYVPPRFAYRTVYSPVTVYSYRPVTAYDPITAQPTTCLQPAVSTGCQPARQSQHCLWWLNPCNWFSGHWGGGSGGCCGAPAPAPTQTYCGSYAAQTCGTASCAQPYYPVQPVVPVMPIAPANTIPSIRSPIIGTPTVPAPPTRFNAVPGTVLPGTGLPADTRPSLQPGGSFTPAPGGTFTPAPGSGSFNSGSNYPPAIDPYSSSSNTPATSSPTTSAPARGSFQTDPKELEMTGPVLRQPGVSGASSALHPDVQPVPDPDAHQPARAINKAPQLLDPRDKSASSRSPHAERAGLLTRSVTASKPASNDLRWAVVPAVWPKPAAEPRYEHRSLTAPAMAPSAPVVDAAQYDDGGWKSGGF